MRIVYGVHGYTRGHATRAASILTDLQNRHQVLILAGGDAYDALAPRFEVTRIPTLGFTYGRDGKLSKWETIRNNLPKLWDLFAGGPDFAEVAKAVRRFGPDVVISDAEAWTHRVAWALRIPRIGFDHFGLMVYCNVPMAAGDRMASFVDRTVYRTLMGSPEKVLISSFYEANPSRHDVGVVGPMLGDDVLELKPTLGAHLLVYLNMGIHQWTPRLERALTDCGLPVRVYGPGLGGSRGPITFFEPSRDGFLADLAACRAVVSTAGNQLVGEAIHLGKPMLVMPEATVEQRMNAAAVARMGIGEVSSFERIDGATVRAFLAGREAYVAATRRYASDGRRAAIDRLETWCRELAARGSLQPAAA